MFQADSALPHPRSCRDGRPRAPAAEAPSETEGEAEGSNSREARQPATLTPTLHSL